MQPIVIPSASIAANLKLPVGLFCQTKCYLINVVRAGVEPAVTLEDSPWNM